MAKITYIGNGSSHKVKKIYIGDGTSKKVKKGYIGENNLSKIFFSGETQWNRYNIVTTYKWNRYTIKETPIYTTYEDWDRISNRYSEMQIGSGGRARVYVWRTRPTITNGVCERYDRTTNLSGSGGPLLAGYVGLTSNPYTLYQDVGSFLDYDQNVIMHYEGEWVRTTDRVQTGTQQSQGSFVDAVTGTTSNQYPSNGVSGSYWYVSNGSTQSQGSFIDIVTSDNENAYPDNGISGNYWYVKIVE